VSYFASGRITAAQLEALVPRTIIKVADETVNNSTTLQNDDELLFPVAASAKYTIHGRIKFITGATPDLKFGWTFPTGLTMDYSIIGFSGGTFAAYAFDQTSTPEVDGAGVNDEFFIDGVVTVSTTAGTLQFQWAQNTLNATDSKVLAKSYLTLQQVVSF
jgi:hypothetical protein